MRFHFTRLLPLLFFASTLAHSAAPTAQAQLRPASQDAATQAIKKLLPNSDPTFISVGPIRGVSTYIVNHQPLYVSNDGRYIIQGEVYDMNRRSDISEMYRSQHRRILIGKISKEDRIHIQAPNSIGTIVVFVDMDCPYCRQFISNMDSYLDAGLSIDIIFFPRQGVQGPSYQAAIDVWCAKDRIDALKAGFISSPKSHLSCKNPIASHLELARDLQLPGTPSILTTDGQWLGTLMPQDEVKRRLLLLKSK